MDKQQVNQADLELGSELKVTPTHIQNDDQPRLTIHISSIVEKISSASCRVLTVILKCSGFIIGVVMTMLIYCVGLVIGITGFIPVLVLILLAARLAQFKLNGEHDFPLQQVKLYVRGALCVICVGFLAIMVVIFFIRLFLGFHIHREGFNLTLSHTQFHVADWASLACLMCVLYIFSYLFLVFQIGAELFRMNSASGQAVGEIIDCLIFWGAERVLMSEAPALKPHKLLGMRVQKWIEQSIFLFIGFNIITLFTYSIVGLLRRCLVRLYPDEVEKHWWSPLMDNVLPRRFLLYYAHGLRSNVHFLLTSLLLLLTWILYFGSQLSETRWSPSVVRFFTLTFFSLVVFSFLCLLKDVVLLTWEANAIYIRLSSRIVQAGEQLYFLGIIGLCCCDIFGLLYTVDAGSSDTEQADTVDEWKIGSDPDKERRLSQRKRDELRNVLLLPDFQTPTIYDIGQVAQTFLATRNALSDDMSTYSILKKFEGDNDIYG